MARQAPVLAKRQLYQRRFFFKTYSGEKTYTTHGCANRLPAVTSYSELKIRCRLGNRWSQKKHRNSGGGVQLSDLLCPYAITPRTNALKTSEI
jgi:hypothetical protein